MSINFEHIAKSIKNFKTTNFNDHAICSYLIIVMWCFQVSESSSDFWNGIELTWQQCSNLPMKCNVTSVAELDGNVYIAVTNHRFPLVYDSHKDEWSLLPKLPYKRFSLVTAHHRKQLLAIGGGLAGVISDKVFAWDEDSKNWTTPYPNMPTPRQNSSSISHGSAVIVAGGVTRSYPVTLTGVVEVLHITKHSSWDSKSCSGQWSMVEQLPHATCGAMPLIVDDHLYIAGGYDDDRESTCNIVTASLPELLQSGIKRTTSGKVWHKLPDMPYSSRSITHYQGRLIIFNGDRKVAPSRENKWELVKQSYLYNPSTNSWDYAGNDLHNYKLGRAVHLEENKIIFMGGLTGTFNTGKENDLVKTCSMLTFIPK